MMNKVSAVWDALCEMRYGEAEKVSGERDCPEHIVNTDKRNSHSCNIMIYNKITKCYTEWRFQNNSLCFLIFY